MTTEKENQDLSESHFVTLVKEIVPQVILVVAAVLVSFLFSGLENLFS